MLLSRDDAKAILDRALSYTKADEAEVSLSGSSQGNLRFARNAPTTSGQSATMELSITCVFGRKVGSYSTTRFDDASLEEAVRRAEELAKLSPESPEYMPRLGPQTYLETPEWDEGSTKLSAEERAAIAGQAIGEASKRDLTTAGYFENGEGFSALANTRGLFAYHRSSNASYTLTVRTPDGSGSGWAASESHRAANIDGRMVTDRAIDKAIRSKSPAELEPGTYRVILEPSALA